jgi:hypothetical protein
MLTTFRNHLAFAVPYLTTLAIEKISIKARGQCYEGMLTSRAASAKHSFHSCSGGRIKLWISTKMVN